MEKDKNNKYYITPAPDAQIMCFLRDYAERYDWLVQVFQDWSFTFLSSFLFYEDYDEMEEETRDIYRAGMAAFEGIAPEYHIELRQAHYSMGFPFSAVGNSNDVQLHAGG